MICLNLQSKVLLMMLVYIPKFLISLCLCGCGCIWLLASETIGDLILNSLALAFVVQVDELLANTFFPHHFLKEIESLVVAMPYDPIDDDEIKHSNKRANEF